MGLTDIISGCIRKLPVGVQELVLSGVEKVYDQLGLILSEEEVEEEYGFSIIGPDGQTYSVSPLVSTNYIIGCAYGSEGGIPNEQERETIDQCLSVLSLIRHSQSDFADEDPKRIIELLGREAYITAINSGYICVENQRARATVAGALTFNLAAQIAPNYVRSLRNIN